MKTANRKKILLKAGSLNTTESIDFCSVTESIHGVTGIQIVRNPHGAALRHQMVKINVLTRENGGKTITLWMDEKARVVG